MSWKSLICNAGLAVVFVCGGGLAIAQEIQPDQAGFGGQYSSLRPEQKRLVDDWFERFSQVIGAPVAPEEGYNNLPLSVRTTFNAVTHALVNTSLTDSSGNRLAETALGLVSRVDSVAGQVPGAGGDKQFRMYLQLAPEAFEMLTRSQEFARKADNTVFHKGYPTCFRSGGGTPSIQVSISRDESRADIDVDYRSSKFPAFLVNGHLSSSNSDVRAGDNLNVHNRQWSGLQNWWRNLLGLPYLDQPEPEFEDEVVPRNPRVRASEKPEEAVHDFLNSWLVEGAPEQSVAYVSEQAYACMELESGKPVDRGMAKFVLLGAMQSASKRIGNVATLADVSVGVRLLDERLRVLDQPYHAQFVLYDVREDLAQQFLCENKLENAVVPPRAARSEAFGKYIGAVFRPGTSEQTGETVATLWQKEGGYWKLVSYEVEPDAEPIQVPDLAAAPPPDDTPPLSRVDGDRSMIQAADDFLEQWLVRRRVNRALNYVAPSANACVNLYRSEDSPALETPEAERTALRQGMTELAEATRPARTLDEAIVAIDPHHPDLMLVNHDLASAFAIVSLPDYMAGAADCSRRERGQEPDLTPASTGRSHGNYYAVGFTFQHTIEDPAVLWTVWGKQDDAWKVVSYLILTP